MSTLPNDPRLIARGARRGRRGRRFGAALARATSGQLPVVIGLVVIWVIFVVASNGNFLLPVNLVNLSLQMAAIGTIAVGVVFVLLLGEIDLSVGRGVSGLCGRGHGRAQRQSRRPGARRRPRGRLAAGSRSGCSRASGSPASGSRRSSSPWPGLSPGRAPCCSCIGADRHRQPARPVHHRARRHLLHRPASPVLLGGALVVLRRRSPAGSAAGGGCGRARCRAAALAAPAGHRRSASSSPSPSTVLDADRGVPLALVLFLIGRGGRVTSWSGGRGSGGCLRGGRQRRGGAPRRHPGRAGADCRVRACERRWPRSAACSRRRASSPSSQCSGTGPELLNAIAAASSAGRACSAAGAPSGRRCSGILVIQSISNGMDLL